MKTCLFLDDLRKVEDVIDSINFDCILTLRSYKEAVTYMEMFGCPNIIYFDHDLGKEKTGYDLAKWIVNKDLDEDFIPEDFEFHVHSANPIGRENIEKLLGMYLKHKEEFMEKQK